MNESRRRQVVTAAIHVIIWLLLVVVVVYFGSVESIRSEKGAQLVSLLAFMAAIYYINHFLLIPRFLLKRQFAAYALFTLLLLLVAWFAPDFLSEPTQLNPGPPDLPRHLGMRGGRIPRPPRSPRFLLPFMTLLTTLLSVTLSLISNWQSRDKQEANMQANQLKTELTFLKNQISPHFFFNTLNSIYALTETDPEQARKVIHRLSKMMRYLLYESEQSQRVPIHRETDFLDAYVELMRIRLPESVTVEYETNIQNPGVFIPPLLLIPLVENTFKHGVSMKEPVTIRILLEQKAGSIELTTTNALITASEALEKGGIGLTNLRRRLEIIYSPQDYALTINEENSTFEAQLKLKTWDSTASL